MVRYAGFNAEFDKMLVVARKAATRQFDTLDATAIGLLSDRYQIEALNSDGRSQAKYTSLGGRLDTAAYRNDLELTMEAHRDALSERDYGSIQNVFGDQAERLAGLDASCKSCEVPRPTARTPWRDASSASTRRGRRIPLGKTFAP